MRSTAVTSGRPVISAVLADGDGVGAEFLAQGHGDGVLELGAAHFDDGAEFQGFGGAGFFEFCQGVEQFPGGEDGAEFHGGGVDVVGGLGEVDVVVGVQPGVVALGAAEDFQRAVGDDFVGVHVRGRPGAALDDVHHELVGESAGQDVLAGLFDGVGAFGVQESEFSVGADCGELDRCQAPDQVHVGGQFLAGDGEVLHRPQRVHTPVGAGRDVPVPQQVMLRPGTRGCGVRKDGGGRMRGGHGVLRSLWRQRGTPEAWR
jgi:hypothetical protein